MDAYSESRQSVLTAVSVKLVPAKYILTIAKTKFTIARILKSKDQLSNPSLLLTTKISLTVVKTRCPDPLEHETLGYKKGRNGYF